MRNHILSLYLRANICSYIISMDVLNGDSILYFFFFALKESERTPNWKCDARWPVLVLMFDIFVYGFQNGTHAHSVIQMQFELHSPFAWFGCVCAEVIAFRMEEASRCMVCDKNKMWWRKRDGDGKKSVNFSYSKDLDNRANIFAKMNEVRTPWSKVIKIQVEELYAIELLLG